MAAQKPVKDFFKEFREFAVKGNVVDLAVGVIIGGAFGKIVSSLVSDIIMPVISVIIGGVNFKDLAVTIRGVQIDPGTGLELSKPILITYGAFLQTLFDFTIIALSIFAMVKVINKMKRKQEETAKEAPAKTKEEALLEEIRDILKQK